MKTGLRVVALFAVYGSIGFGGDYAVDLLARNASDDRVHVRHAPEAVVVDVQAHVVVDVKQAIVTRVHIRHGGDCTFEMDREMTIPADDVNLLKIDAGAGALHVEGREGLEEIIVVGMVCASDEGYLEALQLTMERSPSGDVTLVTHYPQQRNRSGRNNTARIDLTVLMPLGLNVDIEDSSGDMRVSGTGDLTIDDSSGSIHVSGVHGSLRLDDSSAGIVIQDVSGDVSVEDGSGSIEIRNIEGTVLVRDGSGGIEVRNVGGDFVVERDGSGGISHSGVEGRVEIPVRRRRGG